MGLTDVIQKMLNSTSRFTKNTLVAGTILAGSLFAQQAYAQDVDKPKQDEEVSISDEPETVEKKLRLIYGKVEADAEFTPSRQTFSGNAEFKFGIGNFRPVLYAEVERSVFEQDPTDLKYTSTEFGLGTGFFLVKNEKTEFYLEPIATIGTGRYEDAIDLDVDTVGLGIKAGVADKKNGTRLVLKYLNRFGDFNGKLQSGYKVKGDVSTQYGALDFTQRIWSKGRKSTPEAGELDKLVQGEEFSESAYLLIGLSLKDDKLKEFVQEDGYGVRFGIEYVCNWKQNGKGSTLHITPQVLIEKIKAENDIARMDVDALRIRPSVNGEWEIGSGWVASGKIGYEIFERDIKATSGNRDEDKNGLYLLFGLGKRF